jgi:hypothetical protein
MPLVFQYGSNCLEERLNSPERLNGGARYDGRAQTVDQYEIVFDVWSRGNGCAAADLRAVETREQHVWGVLYQVTDEGFGRLRQVEGPGTKKSLLEFGIYSERLSMRRPFS